MCSLLLCLQKLFGRKWWEKLSYEAWEVCKGCVAVRRDGNENETGRRLKEF